MSSTVRVRVMKAFYAAGKMYAVGDITTLSALDAHAAMARCELLDPLDRTVIAEAVQTSNRSALAAERQRAALGGPWR